MTAPFPDSDAPDPGLTWYSNFLISAAAMKSNIIDLLNILRKFSAGWLGEAISAGSVTLATSGTNYAGTATVTFTLNSQRRVRIDALGRYTLGSTTAGQATVQAAYNSGSSANASTGTMIGARCYIPNNSGVAGINGAATGDAMGTVVLPAGTYTAYGMATRTTGGSATDGFASSQTIVTDLGAA